MPDYFRKYVKVKKIAEIYLYWESGASASYPKP